MSPLFASSVVDHLVYDAFGTLTGQTPGQTSPRFTYAGRQYDADAGLYYNRARWYDSSTGRFISEDPLGFAAGDVNLSRYCGNSPVNHTDPSGQFDIDAGMTPRLPPNLSDIDPGMTPHFPAYNPEPGVTPYLPPYNPEPGMTPYSPPYDPDPGMTPHFPYNPGATPDAPTDTDPVTVNPQVPGSNRGGASHGRGYGIKTRYDAEDIDGDGPAEGDGVKLVRSGDQYFILKNVAKHGFGGLVEWLIGMGGEEFEVAGTVAGASLEIGFIVVDVAEIGAAALNPAIIRALYQHWVAVEADPNATQAQKNAAAQAYNDAVRKYGDEIKRRADELVP